MKYILTTDGDGHWYVVPVEKEAEFSLICDAIGEFWDSNPPRPMNEHPPEIPAYAVQVGGAPSRVEFTGYTIR